MRGEQAWVFVSSRRSFGAANCVFVSRACRFQCLPCELDFPRVFVTVASDFQLVRDLLLYVRRR